MSVKNDFVACDGVWVSFVLYIRMSKDERGWRQETTTWSVRRSAAFEVVEFSPMYTVYTDRRKELLGTAENTYDWSLENASTRAWNVNFTSSMSASSEVETPGKVVMIRSFLVGSDDPEGQSKNSSSSTSSRSMRAMRESRTSSSMRSRRVPLSANFFKSANTTLVTFTNSPYS